MTNSLIHSSLFDNLFDENFGKIRTKILENLQNFENLGREKNVESVDLGERFPTHI